VTPETRIGAKVDVFEVPEDESQDVDTFEDLRSVAATLNGRKLASM
jgi:CMP-N-acetylneuraminic acid synthetase